MVSLVIIALLGMAYLQQVKMDRFATAKYERDYMTLVINGILADLRGRLHEDVFENRQRGRAPGLPRLAGVWPKGPLLRPRRRA